jgi:pimeloyl-ACP methyl ester carboxylesterase
VAAGGAAGWGDIFKGIKAGAIRFMNYLTYFEMKARAGTVGAKGVAPLIDKLSRPGLRIHLVGHSFGGRVVAAAALNSTAPIQTMSLLQTAFSHNGFSKSMGGFFRAVVDKRRVKGPILVTYTPNDKAVGIAYPAASRLSGDVASAFGDKNDKYGGLGRNGAQKMAGGEIANEAELRARGAAYKWQPGLFHNLESSKYIVDPKGGDAHGFVTGPEVAWAIRSAID